MSSTLVANPPHAGGPVAVSLLGQAKRGLAQAEWETDPVERFTAAYASAVRAGAAVLAARGRPHRGRARPTSVWVLLESAAPELAEWALFFSMHSGMHAAAQAGIRSRIGVRSADDMLRQAWQFVELTGRVVSPGISPRRAC